MNIFQDIHTYLIISFILTAFFLFKVGYKKFDNSITKNINDIKDKITSLENRKQEAEKQLEVLKNELIIANQMIDKSFEHAENKAKKITDKSNVEISKIVMEKQKEYEIAVGKIKSGLSTELQNKIIKLVVKNLAEKLQDAENSREFQNINIENSTKMLEDLVDKYVK